MMSSKVLYFRKECMYQYISVNKPHESQILAHKHFLVHFNLVTNVLFCLCLSFLSLVVLRWLLLLFLSCGFLLTVMWFMLFILMFVSNNDNEMMMVTITMLMNCFAVWLTDKKRVTLLPVTTSIREPHQRESRTRHEQFLSLCGT